MATPIEMVLFTRKIVVGQPDQWRVWCRVTLPAYTPGDTAAIAAWWATHNTMQAMQRQLPAALAGTPLEGSGTYLLPASYYDQMIAMA